MPTAYKNGTLLNELVAMLTFKQDTTLSPHLPSTSSRKRKSASQNRKSIDPKPYFFVLSTDELNYNQEDFEKLNIPCTVPPQSLRRPNGTKQPAMEAIAPSIITSHKLHFFSPVIEKLIGKKRGSQVPIAYTQLHTRELSCICFSCRGHDHAVIYCCKYCLLLDHKFEACATLDESLGPRCKGRVRDYYFASKRASISKPSRSQVAAQIVVSNAISHEILPAKDSSEKPSLAAEIEVLSGSHVFTSLPSVSPAAIVETPLLNPSTSYKVVTKRKNLASYPRITKRSRISAENNVSVASPAPLIAGPAGRRGQARPDYAIMHSGNSKINRF